MKEPRVVDYIVEEIFRQGHDVANLDGIERVGWMLDAWAYALRCTGKPGLNDAIVLGQLVERHKNVGGIRTCRVRVGSRLCPEPETIVESLKELWRQRDELAPLEFYRRFELIHPFLDGNGRAGKILMAWLAGKLLAPEFPPADLFGHPIRNP